MKLLALYVCLIATVVVVHARTIMNAALHNGSLSVVEMLKCYQNANLTEAELITDEEIKDGSFNDTEKARKNGCFMLCVFQKRGLIVDSNIQKEKFYGNENLSLDTQAKIRQTVNACVEEVEQESDICNKSLFLFTCLSTEI